MAKTLDMELFRSGDYGTNGAYSEQDIDDIIKNTVERNEDIPIVAGHQSTEHEKGALGWIKKNLLRREGKQMFGGSEILSEFFPILEKKIYKNRSVEIAGDGNGKKWLARVAILGASLPIVKGMKELNLSFGDDTKTVEYIFSETKQEDIKKMDKITTQFSEDQVNIMINGKLSEQKANFDAKFSEQKSKIETLENEKKALEIKVKNFSEKLDKQEIETLVDGFIKDGKIEPSKRDSKIILFSEAKKNPIIFEHLKEEMKVVKKFEFGEDEDALKERKNLDQYSEEFGIDNKDLKKYADGLVL